MEQVLAGAAMAAGLVLLIIVMVILGLISGFFKSSGVKATKK